MRHHMVRSGSSLTQEWRWSSSIGAPSLCSLGTRCSSGLPLAHTITSFMPWTSWWSRLRRIYALRSELGWEGNFLSGLFCGMWKGRRMGEDERRGGNPTRCTGTGMCVYMHVCVFKWRSLTWKKSDWLTSTKKTTGPLFLMTLYRL